MIPNPNDVAAEVAVNIITEIFKSCLSGIKKAGRRLKIESKSRDFWGSAAKVYFDNFIKRYNKIKILGMHEPVSLEGIYIEVNILDKIASREYLPGDIDNFFDFSDRDPIIIEQQRIDGLAAVSENKNLVVLGRPGAGKTTFLRYIGIHYISGMSKNKKIPIFISLRQFSESVNINLMDYIIEQFDICNFPEEGRKEFIKRLLVSGKTILLLDGLDEVREININNVVNEVSNFSEKYNKSQFVITCRTASYVYRFVNFKDVEVADFNDSQVESFIRKWFCCDDENHKKAISCIHSINNTPAVKELTKTPLLLTLLCMNYNDSLGFSVNRAETYENGVLVLLKHWDSTRNIKRDDIYKELTAKRKEQLFSIIAWRSFTSEYFFIKRAIIEEYITEFYKNLPEIDKEDISFDSSSILQAIEAQHGIIVERAYNIFSFLHLTFQEYFVARYCIDQRGSNFLYNLIADHLTDNKWREVFFLISELLPPDADFFFLAMKKRVDELLFKDDFLINLIKIINNEIIKEYFDIPKYYLRFIVLHFILGKIWNYKLKLTDQNHYVPPPTNLYEVQKTSLKLAEEARNIVRGAPAPYMPPSSGSNILNDKTNRIVNNILYSIKDYNVSEKEFDNLISYLNANEILIICLQSRCYITKDTRANIYDKLIYF